MYVEDAKMTQVPLVDPTLGTFSMTLIVIDLGGMDGDVTALQGMIAALKSEVGRIAAGSLTVTVTVLGRRNIVIMGMYRNAGIAYDEVLRVLEKHGVATDTAPQLSDSTYGDDRYRPGTLNELPHASR